MKNVLLPIDFTESCYKAIDYAISFFKIEECNFYLLNTYSYELQGLNSIDFLSFSESDYDHPKQESYKNLGVVIKKYTLNNTVKKHFFHAVSEYGNLVENIQISIEKLSIDLVIIDGKKNNAKDPNCSYSKNTKIIIDQIRTCPVMVVPEKIDITKRPNFILVSHFNKELSLTEINKWYPLVKAAKGNVKLVSLTSELEMSDVQKLHQREVIFEIEKLSGIRVNLDFLINKKDLKQFAETSQESIICIVDPQPDIWRKWGLVHSYITNLGPLENTPLIALHS